MITSLAQHIAGFLLKKEVIDGKKLDIYIYGFEIMISSILNILIALLIGLAFSQLIECVVFLVVFIYMRKYCGGYHAETYLKCNFAFTLNLLALISIIKLSINFPIYIIIGINICCIVIIAIFAPIANVYKPIIIEDRKKHKITAIILGLVFSSISMMLYFINQHYCIVIDTALLSVALSIVIEKIRKGSGYNEKEIREENS